MALALCPGMSEAEFNIGFLLEKAGGLPEALACYERARERMGGDAAVHFAIGNVCCKLQRLVDAAAAYRTALHLRPDFAQAWLNLGNTSRLQNDLVGAVDCYQRVAELQPESADAHVNLANAYRAQNRLAEARASCARALALAPGSPEAHLNLAMALLVGGELRTAWPHAEYRHAWKLGGAGREFAQPRWTGGDSIAGRRLLLHGEQGLGDTLQFVRYVRLVAERGATVHVEVQPPLRDLLAASLPEAETVLAHGEPLPEFDLHCPLASLPLAFGTELATVPARIPYLTVPDRAATRWRGCFGAERGLKVGLAWAGNPTHPNDFNRSLALAEFGPVCAPLPGARFFSLKKEMSAADETLLGQWTHVTNLARHLRDFSDTAALIEQLDLVITVDTSIAHLAGALGKPVWVMLPFSPDWRWLLGREDSPWYPTARLFRQVNIGAWQPVLQGVRMELEHYVATQ